MWFVFLVLLSTCFAYDPSQDDPMASVWEQFKIDYNKTYINALEEQYRFTIFVSNSKIAAQMDEDARVQYTEKYGANRVRYGINGLADMTPEEFRTQYLMTNMPAPPNGTYLPIPSTEGIPDTWDWRQKGVITPVYNQGTCGSCWTFSATECTESATALAGHGLKNLAMQQIIDCDDESQHGCSGGWPLQAWQYINSVGGLDALSCYPYTGTDGQCHFNPSCRQGTVNNFGWLSHTEYDIAVWMVAHGPVSICVDASNWQYYKGGIVPAGQCGTSIDHAIQMVGYVTSSPSYWIVRNSWGTSWGISGYIYLEEGTNTCGLAQYPAGALY